MNARIPGIIILLMACLYLLASCCSRTHEGPEMKVIIADDGTIGRYIGEDGTSYIGEIQDEYHIGKDKAHTAIMRARDGQGILTLRNPGKEPAYIAADTASEVIGTMVHEEGYVPEVYCCLGYSDGWYAAEIGGRRAYIQEKKARWDAVSSF